MARGRIPWWRRLNGRTMTNEEATAYIEKRFAEHLWINRDVVPTPEQLQEERVRLRVQRVQRMKTQAFEASRRDGIAFRGDVKTRKDRRRAIEAEIRRHPDWLQMNVKGVAAMVEKLELPACKSVGWGQLRKDVGWIRRNCFGAQSKGQ